MSLVLDIPFLSEIGSDVDDNRLGWHSEVLDYLLSGVVRIRQQHVTAVNGFLYLSSIEQLRMSGFEESRDDQR